MKKHTLAFSVITILIAIGVIPNTMFLHNIDAATGAERKCPCPKVSIVTSGNNIYIAWWTNNTSNDEVMFRASTDWGKTFGEKMNLSNSSQADSQEVEIATFGNNDAKIIVSWWERNQTINEPVFRISSDNGKTFEPVLNLSANDPISTNISAGR